MWIVLFFAGSVLFVLHAFYFSRRVTQSLSLLFPRLRRGLRPGRWIYLVVATSVPVLALLYALYVVIVRPDSFGAPRSRVYDYLVSYPFWLVTIYSFQVTLLVLPLDLVHWALRKLGRATGERWLRRKAVVTLALAAVFLVYVPVRILVDDRSLMVRHYDYASDVIPGDLDGYRIALIADLQADPDTGEARLAQLVDAVNREKPDLVLIAGDMVTRDAQDIEVAAREAGRLRARDGVYACVGDHDNFVYFLDHERSVREIRDALARHGVLMLDDELRTIKVGAARLAVVFLTQNYISKANPKKRRQLLEEASAADVQVVLTHQTKPDLLADARAAGVELVLAGHTHGGQVRFWLPFFDLVPVRFETPYVSGAYDLGHTKLIVTNGLGVSVAPFRYRSTASAEVIRLRRSPTIPPPPSPDARP